MDKRITVSRPAARQIRRGHPWVWNKAVLDIAGEPGLGDAIAINDEKDRPIGVGFFDPSSPIRARHLGRRGDVIEAGWAAELTRRALALRALHPDLAGAEAMRVVHGEADSMGGLVIDRYGEIATVQFDGKAAEAFWGARTGEIFEVLAEAGVTGLFCRGRGAIAGEVTGRTLVVNEGEARFEVDLERGQKTGLFLDQRPHRFRVGRMSKGKAVLNLFCYTGGFSVHAGLGGAREVVSVDSAAPAVEAAERNAIQSGLDVSTHRFVAADAFEFLNERKNRRRYNLVICDPPSFAPRRNAVAKAKRAYVRLNQLAMGAVARRGILITASCSSHIDRVAWGELIAEAAARSKRPMRVIDESGPGPDHPSRPGFPEGDYLKVVTLAME